MFNFVDVLLRRRRWTRHREVGSFFPPAKIKVPPSSQTVSQDMILREWTTSVAAAAARVVHMSTEAARLGIAVSGFRVGEGFKIFNCLLSVIAARIGRGKLTRHELESWLRSTPKRSQGSEHLFRSIHDKGRCRDQSGILSDHLHLFFSHKP